MVHRLDDGHLLRFPLRVDDGGHLHWDVLVSEAVIPHAVSQLDTVLLFIELHSSVLHLSTVQ